MSEKFGQKKYELIAAILAAAFLWAPLYMAQFQKDGQAGSFRYPEYADYGSTQTQTTPFNDAAGVKRIARHECFQRETVGECAARIVQADVRQFYLFLVIVGIIQAATACLTWYLLRQQTEIQRRQAETLPILEQAYIYPSAPDATRFAATGAQSLPRTAPTENGRERPDVGIRFCNYGKTPGFIKCIRIEVSVDYQGPQPNFVHSRELWGKILARPDKQTSEIRFPSDREFTATEANAVSLGEKPVIVFGWVKYTDVFNTLHTEAFGFLIRQRIGEEQICELFGGPAYNYHKKEKPSLEFSW